MEKIMILLFCLCGTVFADEYDSCHNLFEENATDENKDKCELLAKQGKPEAQYLYGKYLVAIGMTKPLFGATSVKILNKFATDGMYWLQKSAEQGNAKAQSDLGLAYLQTNIVKNKTEKYKQAIYWFQKSANQGEVSAQQNLGSMYYHGYGVKQDYTKAFYWHQKAAEQGNVLSYTELGAAYQDGKGVTKDCSKSLYWYQKAADQDERHAQNNLAILYRDGKCVKRDSVKSHYWALKSHEDDDSQ